MKACNLCGLKEAVIDGYCEGCKQFILERDVRLKDEHSTSSK